MIYLAKYSSEVGNTVCQVSFRAFSFSCMRSTGDLLLNRGQAYLMAAQTRHFTDCLWALVIFNLLGGSTHQPVAPFQSLPPLVRGCLFICFAAILHIRRIFHYPPPAVVPGCSYSSVPGIIVIIIISIINKIIQDSSGETSCPKSNPNPSFNMCGSAAVFRHASNLLKF